MRQWKRNRVSYLQRSGQSGKALELQRQLAVEAPHEWSLQRDYAQALFNAQLSEQGYAWLDGVLVPESRWLPSEESYLRDLYAEWLRVECRYDELADYLAESFESKPGNETLYRRYLSALFQSDRIDEVNRVMARWLAEGRTQEKLPDDVAARISAATSQALGDGYNFHTDRLDERWLDPLSSVVRFFADHESHARLAERIVNHHRFQQTDHCRALRREALKRLEAEMETLAPDQAAVEQRLASLQLARRDVELYKDLGRRFDALEQPAQSERAYTSLVEMLPRESEGHAALAKIRQNQDRWGDAAEHWQQVAEIRSLEPTGLLRLAEAQIHLQRWDDALATLRKLDTTVWPSRFGDIHNQVRQLQRQVEKQRQE